MQIFFKQSRVPTEKFQPIFRTYKHISHAENCFILKVQKLIFLLSFNFPDKKEIHRHSPQVNLS